MAATLDAMAYIKTGLLDCVLVGGVESMSNVPYVVQEARWGIRLQDRQFADGLIHGLQCGSIFVPYPKDGPVEWARGKPYIMGQTAEFLALRDGWTREQQDEVALRSHNMAERANTDGTFKDEVTPVVIKDRKKAEIVVDKDEHFRPGLTMEDLANKVFSELGNKDGFQLAQIRKITIRNENLNFRMGMPFNSNRSFAEGVAIRIRANNAWGFASTNDLTPESVMKTAKAAWKVSKASANVGRKNQVTLADEPAYEDNYSVTIKKDPFKMDLEEKADIIVFPELGVFFHQLEVFNVYPVGDEAYAVFVYALGGYSFHHPRTYG